jgi:hypothetical protein
VLVVVFGCSKGPISSDLPFSIDVTRSPDEHWLGSSTFSWLGWTTIGLLDWMQHSLPKYLSHDKQLSHPRLTMSLERFDVLRLCQKKYGLGLGNVRRSRLAVLRSLIARATRKDTISGADGEKKTGHTADKIAGFLQVGYLLSRLAWTV